MGIPGAEGGRGFPIAESGAVSGLGEQLHDGDVVQDSRGGALFEPAGGHIGWSHLSELNRRPARYESAARLARRPFALFRVTPPLSAVAYLPPANSVWWTDLWTRSRRDAAPRTRLLVRWPPLPEPVSQFVSEQRRVVTV